MVPIRYNVRNLRARWVNTLMTVLGTGMIVWSSCAIFSLVDGLQHSLNVSGDPLDLIILRKGSTTETTSGVDAAKAEKVATLAGLARDDRGRPLAAAELVHIPIVERADGGRTNLIIRGVEPASRTLRADFRIVEGRDFEPGKGEAIASALLVGRFRGVRVGETLRVSEKESYRVVGLFTAGGGAAESEVWTDLGDLRQVTHREGIASSVQARANSPADRDRLIGTIRNDPQFTLEATTEADFYRQQSRTADFYKGGGLVIAFILSVGAMFAAANTMFAAVGARTREIGTMRALGFSRFSILMSFLGESVLLCALGGVVGLLATLPLALVSFGTSNQDTFAEVSVHFRTGPLVLAVAAAMTLAMGIFGGLFPAVRAVRMDVISSLREL